MIERPNTLPVADHHHRKRHVNPWLCLSIVVRLAVATVILYAALGQDAAHIAVTIRP